MLDRGLEAEVNTSMAISDHFPICGSWKAPLLSFSVWKLPAVMDVKGKKPKDHIWAFQGTTYAEWTTAAISWIASACEVKPKPKGCLSSSLFSPSVPPPDKVYSAIVKARGLISRLDRCQESGVLAKLRGVLATVDLEHCEDHEALLSCVHEKMRSYLNTMRDSALTSWRAKVKLWTSSPKILYSYLKNPLPAKPLALSLSTGVTTSHPNVPYHFTLSAATLHDTIKRMNRSSPGPDGWHLDELQMLPKSAWESLLPILEREPHSESSSSLSLYKRVPIEKSNTSIPPPNMIRPIDVYSVVLRAYTSAQAAMLRSWLKQVVHPCQYASSYGAQVAPAKINIYAEMTLHRLKETWALAIDFSKMFNTLSLAITLQTSSYMGLSQESIEALQKPLRACRGFWRLPHNAVSPMETHSRGLPQGVSTSVALAEIMVSVLLRKILRVAVIDIVSYVDDVNVLANSEAVLAYVWGLVVSFAKDFRLDLALQKCHLWGTHPTRLSQLAEE